ncbi:MAG: helix-turn-helix domain-containing protein [Eubacteriales bacterium]
MNKDKSEYNELPTMLNASEISEVLGISKAKAYELMNSREFPTLRIGKRMMVSKEQLIHWINKESSCL